MTKEQKLENFDRTVAMLKLSIKSMQKLKKEGYLSENGEGSLERAINTLEWLQGGQTYI